MVDGMVFTTLLGSRNMSTLKSLQIRRWTVGLVFKYCPMFLVSSQRQFLNHVYFQARQVALGTCGSYNCQLKVFCECWCFFCALQLYRERNAVFHTQLNVFSFNDEQHTYSFGSKPWYIFVRPDIADVHSPKKLCVGVDS